VALALYDLDNTLLAGDCEHAWCEFLVDTGVLDGDDMRAENERLYGEYLAGALDIRESIKFQLGPSSSTHWTTCAGGGGSSCPRASSP
jgi:phosphoserine phosphatase